MNILSNIDLRLYFTLMSMQCCHTIVSGVFFPTKRVFMSTSSPFTLHGNDLLYIVDELSGFRCCMASSAVKQPGSENFQRKIIGN